MATKYAKSSQTGDMGVVLVKQILAAAGAIFRPFENADIGLDGTIELLTGQREPSGDYAKISDLARGDLVLFYEPRKGGGRGVALGAAVVLEVEVNTPQELYQRFSGLGTCDGRSVWHVRAV